MTASTSTLNPKQAQAALMLASGASKKSVAASLKGRAHDQPVVQVALVQ